MTKDNFNSESAKQLRDEHCTIIENSKALRRKPLYMVCHFLIAAAALSISATTFFQTLSLSPTKEYVPTTNADTPVVDIPTRMPVLPSDNQDISPGSYINEEDSLKRVMKYVADAASDCFTMNYLNYNNVLGRCKAKHLDSETSAPDDFERMIYEAGYIGLMKKNATSMKAVPDVSTATLGWNGIGRFPGPNNTVRERYVWVVELDMELTLDGLSIDAPTRWQFDIVRESVFKKQLPISILQYRAVD